MLGGLVAQTRRAIDAMLYTGMHLSVSCSEDAKHLDLPAARRTDGTTFLGSARVRVLAEACADWTTGDEERGRMNAPRSSVPILLVSGELDPNTPQRHAESTLGGLPNARHIVLAGVAHNWSNVVTCGSDFVADFVASASTKALDVSCAARSSAPPFVVPR
jgi:pimeloyl-ACP methyl ester carboxylesterase